MLLLNADDDWLRDRVSMFEPLTETQRVFIQCVDGGTNLVAIVKPTVQDRFSRDRRVRRQPFETLPSCVVKVFQIPILFTDSW